MTGEESSAHDLGRILRRLGRSISDGHGRTPLSDRLCRAATDLLGCDGGAITLAYTDAERLTLSSTDATANEIEARQEVVQQGPSADAYSAADYRYAVVEPGGQRPLGWPLLDLTGVDDGHAVIVHAVPMTVAGTTLGVLTLWERGRTTGLDPLTARVVAGVIGAALVKQAQEEGGAVVNSWARRSSVHQGVGFVMAQLGVRAADALALIRAHAYVRGTSLAETARDIIEQRLVLSDELEEGTT
ncbi:ANTAR domain-containing protein [Phycicoccus avicenniae]|uniref:ANTAR domain-containing protein n=1 Tax=Phycicoccus avicenniae TaxID=2828860 RepID=UPI003D2C1B68